jgi:hypothetical protein
LALGLILAAALGAYCWVGFACSGDRNPAPELPHSGAPGSASIARTKPPTEALPEGEMRIEPALEVGRASQAPRPTPQAFEESRLVGRGRIRGHVQAAPGLDFPQEWVLTLEPSNVLIGADRAESRTLEFRAGEGDFDLKDLPLGGYMLRASTFGMASEQQHLLLAKPAETELFVQMQLLATAFVEGSVRHPDSTPAIAMELSLEPKPAGARLNTSTDKYGHFLFSDVKQGAYTLHFGHPDSPVREALDVHVGTSPVILPDSIVPQLAELIVRVLRAPNLPVEGVQLDGYGNNGGRIHGVTNADGEYRARSLPPGRYTIDALAKDQSRGRVRQLVEVGVLGLVVLTLDQ